MPSETDAPSYVPTHEQEILIALDSLAAAAGRLLGRLVSIEDTLDSILYTLENR